ncbi:efflux pump antibiotic resistance protein [Aspergillus bertholletiae]|uniref:Efflux pump antibiotic resistance protein n=1 Tax=Aspergillus bertholletiae TaxID=1226010 RepID=A0A5N7B9V6_9EURO|nr:efflux pump antibiotic resistance protein [Aspergillus bertholletiae]
MGGLSERHPELFRPVSRKSSRGMQRTVPLECLVSGVQPHGDSHVTMCNALETLGLQCWHSIQFMSTRFGDIEMWQEAVDRNPEFDQLLHDFGAVSSDTPAIAFADGLIEAYPEAKVVLVERDINTWYESWMNGVIKNTYDPIVTVIYHIDRFFTHPVGRIHKTTFQGWLGISSPEDARRLSKAKYREHYELVRSITPKDRLLEYKLSDGWEPLCEFLGKPVPDKPFPHLNEKKWLDEKVQLVMSQGMKRLALKVFYFLAPLALAGLIYYIV